MSSGAKLSRNALDWRADENLSVMACSSKQRGNHIERVRVQTEFRLIHHDQAGKSLLGLQQE